MTALVSPFTGPLSSADAVRLAGIVKALSDPQRLLILNLLHKRGAMTVSEVTDYLGLSQPTVSHHLTSLVAAGFVEREKQGVFAFHTLVPSALAEVSRVLSPGRRGARA